MDSEPHAPPFTFAPAAIVRTAAWPVESLHCLSASDLRTKALAAENSKQSRTAFEEAYASTMADQRQILWRCTAQDPRFRAAVALSSPSFAHSLTGLQDLPASTKTQRHRETTLYRYLARAVGRTEPAGLWTSVGLATLASDAEDTRVEPGPDRTHVAPDLTPFRAIFRALREREPYRSRGPYRINPGLAREDDGTWTIPVREQNSGRLTWQRLPPSPIPAVLVQAVGPELVSLSALADRLQAHHSAPVDAVLELALEANLLIGGLEFPNRFADPYDALRQAEALLMGEDRVAWRQARLRIRSACKRLEGLLDSVLDSEARDPDGVSEAVLSTGGTVRGTLRQLATQLGLDAPPLPDPVLRCDQSSHARVLVGTRDREHLERLVEEWLDLEAQFEVAEAEQTTARRWLESCGGRLFSPPLSTPPVGPAGPTTADARVEHRGGATPPLTALILRSTDSDWARPFVAGMSNAPTAAHARHAYHLAELDDPLVDWFRGEYRRLAATCGVEVVDLVHDHPGSPNVLARPRYTDDFIAPWNADPGSRIHTNTSLEPGPRHGSLLVSCDGRHLSAHALTATVPSEDVVLQRLLATSHDPRARAAFAESPARGPARAIPSTLSSGGALSTPCTQLSAEEVDSLVGARGRERYRQWCKLAARHQWPQLVRVSRNGRSGLVLAVDSPIAVQAILEGLKPDSTVTVESVIERGFSSTKYGHHLVEMVLPLARREHLWIPSPSSDATSEDSMGPLPLLRNHGEQWLQANIALRADPSGRGQAGPLFEQLRAQLSVWRRDDAVPCWFVRKPPGLRLRIGSAHPELRAQLAGLLAAEANAGRVERWSWSSYEPEVHRLGGPSLLPAIHTLFSADTDLWMAWGDLRMGEQARLAPEVMSLFVVEDLVRQGTEDTAEAWEAWATMLELYGGMPRKPPVFHPSAQGLTVPDPRRVASFPEMNLIARASRTNREFVNRLHRLTAFGRIVVGRRSLLSTLCAFHWNRWGIAPKLIAEQCRWMVELQSSETQKEKETA